MRVVIIRLKAGIVQRSKPMARREACKILRGLSRVDRLCAVVVSADRKVSKSKFLSCVISRLSKEIEGYERTTVSK